MAKNKPAELVSGTVNRLAARCRMAYCIEFSRRMPPEERQGRLYDAPARWDETWIKLAQFLIKNGITNCYAFIAVQLAPTGGRSFTPTPAHCCGSTALDVWYERTSPQAVATSKKLVEVALTYQVDYATRELAFLSATGAKKGWPAGRARELVLNCVSDKMTPLFRYCLAVREKMVDIAKHYLDEAVLEYLTQPDVFDAAYPPNWLTEELKQEAQKWLVL